ncbi:pentapeptide repeat-containing protein [Paenibacillus sp.]|uniref:pentapeptide repeat-containing protein n=1 Tax=Paenibacillus sp. TaxID=58172 RepID=UPI0028B23312|nr:pentapeptide repeat-containing protein [Paenibacillus sp.]
MSENHKFTEPFTDRNGQYLKAECENCFGLCCSALPFSASVDFAMDKAAGQPCHNLQSDFRCGVHTDLRALGFRGCTVYDCFGAGQKLSQVTYTGEDWRKNPKTAKQMFEVFPTMWHLHELLWYLNESLSLKVTHTIHVELQAALDETEQLTILSPESLLKVNVDAHRAKINMLLLQVSELVRNEARRKLKKASRTFSRGVDLVGANLKSADLRGANLRGAYLIAADLRGADLRGADLIGADLRDTDLRGANLTESIFLTQGQINAAKGDDHTKLPPALSRPEQWISF